MASAPLERKDETNLLAPQDRTVLVNGELSRSCGDKDTSCDPEQAQKICGAKKVTDLNGVTICSQTCQSKPGSENCLTQDDSNQSKCDPGITKMSSLEEKQYSEQAGSGDASEKDINLSYVSYESELQMEAIMALITKDLSEPYSIYTYRYFIHNWPKLCFLVSAT